MFYLDMNIKKKWLQSVNGDIQEIVDLLQELDEETIRAYPKPEQWSIMQITSHLNEAIPFWIKHIEDVVKDPSVKWGEGRSFFDNSRLYAISDKHISCLTVNVVMKNLKKLPPAIEKILFSLNNTKLNTTAKSDKLPFKDKTVKYIFKKEVVNHIKGHVYQIKRNLVTLDKIL